MDSRGRLNRALSHQEPDRVPLDLGGIASGITRVAHHHLMELFGYQGEDILIDRIQQLVKPDPRILDFFQIDTRYAYIPVPFHIWTKDQTGSIWTDDWGIERRFTGLYFDMVGHPLREVETLDDLKRFSWPDSHDPHLFVGLSEQVTTIRESGKACIVNIIGSCFEFAWYLRGFENFFMDLVLRPDLACGIMDIMVDFQLGQFKELLSRVGDGIDVVLCGDDLATQNGPFISPDLYRRYIKPRQKKLYDFIKTKTRARLFYHSCGAITPFLPDLIDIGVDILNPVQVKARGVDLPKLKKEWGKKIVFWGGIDTQRVLPFGTPSEVRDEVRRRVDELAPGGGYVLGAVHNIQADVPPQNVIAMYEEALKYGKY
ncbi:MAG: uroporphyrinogen decarboxylase family protein [Atribacterota bacterium]